MFLGEDFAQKPQYSDETARVIDEEVERVLRTGEERCVDLLTENRRSLDLVARSLLEHETISGVEVNRLIAQANGAVQPPPSAPPAAGAPMAPPPIPQHLAPGSSPSADADRIQAAPARPATDAQPPNPIPPGPAAQPFGPNPA